ncbi:MAG: ribonuclease III [Peptococcaceae bacterium]|nr:ribonuclease III [Peptococcaceae bacterium]
MTGERIAALRALLKKLEMEQVDVKLLNQAFIHPSYAMEHHLDGDNQRLEFLGDAVVDLLMGEYLYKMYDSADEGKLTKMRASLVCEEALAGAAEKLGLSALLLLGHGEAQCGGATRPSNLADAWEAMCGAIYLSAGLDGLKPVLVRYLDESIQRVQSGYYGDYKTRLQEVVQRTPNRQIEYQLLEENGPAHDPNFKVAVLVDGRTLGTAWGKSKKAAQREAAMQALVALGELSPVDSLE